MGDWVSLCGPSLEYASLIFFYIPLAGIHLHAHIELQVTKDLVTLPWSPDMLTLLEASPRVVRQSHHPVGRK